MQNLWPREVTCVGPQSSLMIGLEFKTRPSKVLREPENGLNPCPRNLMFGNLSWEMIKHGHKLFLAALCRILRCRLFLYWNIKYGKEYRTIWMSNFGGMVKWIMLYLLDGIFIASSKMALMKDISNADKCLWYQRPGCKIVLTIWPRNKSL